MLRWGILGPGFIADRALAPAMRACGHDLAVVGSRSLSRAQAFAANHGVRRARGSYDDVVTAQDVDAIYVALPNFLHEQWTVAALEAGKHVLCEKPLATDAAAAGRMAAASARNGRVLMEALMYRFHPRTEALLDQVHGGEIGDVRLVNAAFAFPFARPEDHRLRAELGGGALLDVGVYAVSAARWVAGAEPRAVHAVQRQAGDVDETSVALLDFPAGAVATVAASFAAADHELLEVVGTRGVLRAPRPFTAGRDERALLLRDGEEVGAWQADPYEAMVTSFAAAVHGGASTLPPEDAVATASVLDRVRAG
jgi:xylose dehydrogenase (NAD/NADP)